MNRLSELLLAAILAGAVGAVVVGSPLLSIAFVVPGAGLAVWIQTARSARTAERPWLAPRAAAVAPPVARSTGGAGPRSGGGSGTPAVRTVGALLSVWVPVVGLAVFFATYIALTNVISPEVRGPVGSAALASVLAGLVLGAGGVALGVALARWTAFPLAPVAAIVLVGIVSLQLGGGEPGEHSARMLFSTFGPLADSPEPVITAGWAWAHVAWLVAISAATAGVGVVRRSPRDAVVAPAVPLLPALSRP